jgi:hypothetical protein
MKCLPSFSTFFLGLVGGILLLSFPLRADAKDPALPKGQIPLSIDATHRTASLTLPKSASRVTIEFRAKSAKSAVWRIYKIVSVKATPAMARIALPADYSSKSWRATIEKGAVASVPPVVKKFPARFYSGKKSFPAAISKSYAVQTSQPSGITSGKTTSVVANVPNSQLSSDSVNTSVSVAAPTPTTGTPVESDIWETNGTSVYFFNQLRGLQVIDLSTPSNPVLTATYRLPAVGQDLYVVQGLGATNYAILLTQQYDQTTYQSSTGVLMIAVSGSTTQLVSSNNYAGWMADSRMVGNQLYISTQQWDWSVNGNGSTTTLNQMTVDPVGGAIFPGSSQSSQGYGPIISAGDNWLSVSQFVSDWQNSSLTLYGLDTNGATLLTTNPITIQGSVSDEYDVQYNGGYLSVISQQWVQNTNSNSNNWWWCYQPVTTLQSYTPDGTLQGSVQIDSTNYYSTARFAGSTLYLITTGQADKLYTVDNSNPSNPVVAGQVALPGSTSQIDPLGNGSQLFALGYDSNWNLTASLYDVSNLTNPNLLSSVGLSSNANTSWGYSPATYDQKACNVMADAGLVTLPYSCYHSDGSSANYIQLLSLNTNSGSLSLAGYVPTGANPLRSAMLNGALTSITQRELVTADVSNPDAPNVLADLTLAWTVDRIALSGNYLVEFTANSTWDGQTPTATVATSDDPDNALSQTSLGSGTILDAQIRGSNLYVLRQNPSNSGWSPWRIYPLMADSISGAATSSSPSLILDIYDASNLPQLTLMGSVPSQLPVGDSSWDVGRMLFPSSNSVAVVAQPTARNFWWWHGPIVYGGPVMMPAKATAVASATVKATPAMIAVDHSPWFGWGDGTQSTNPASAMTFQVLDPTAPVAFAPIPLTDRASTPVKYATATNGLMVFGYGDKETPCGADSTNSLSTSRHHLGILDLTDIANPVLGPVLDLPGRLQAVSDLSTNGFLAWTMTKSGGTQIQVSACDGVSVSQVASIPLTQDGSITALGYDLFAAQGNSVNRFSLDNSGNLTGTGSISLNWSPTSLSVVPDSSGSGGVLLLGNDWSHLLSSSWTSDRATSVLDTSTETSTDVNLDILLPDQSVLVPENDYGVAHYQP